MSTVMTESVVQETSPPVPESCRTVGRVTADNALLSARGVDVFYGEKRAIKDVSIDIARNQVLAMIGPSSEIFTAPRNRKTDDYITGRFG